MLYHSAFEWNDALSSFKQSLLDFFKLVDSRLILMLSYDSLNLIFSGVQQSHLGCWGHRSEKVKLRGLDNVACKMCQCAVLLKDKFIIRNVFVSYWHIVKMVEHLNNAIHWHAIHAWWRKTSILDMVPKRPDTMTDMVVAKCVRNRWLNAFFPILILFGVHILSFYEWRVVYQWLGDNSDVTCVSNGKST